MHSTPTRRDLRSILTSFGLAAVAAVFALVALPGCNPDYPNCDTDGDCQKDGKKEFCVERKCQQCRNADDCQSGFECQAGKCSAIAGYCRDASQCKAGQSCIANRCRACTSDNECPSGLLCLEGRCGKAQCTKDDECPQDKDCVKGRCVTAAAKSTGGPPCPLSAVYFAFNESSLSAEATSALAGNVECLKKADRPVNLIGHADPRGTDEYNLALSDRRGQSVKEHLKRLGINDTRLRIVPRGALDARGGDEASWAKDRRVDLEWQ